MEFLGRLAGAGVDHERNLRRLSAFLADLAEDLAEIHVDVAIGDGVGRVEDQRVDAGVGQQLRVATNHPRIEAQVVAVQRLAPVVRRADRAPQLRVRLLQRFGVLGEDAGDVVRAVPVRALVGPFVQPEEIEDADEAIRLGCADLVAHRQLAA